MIFKSTEFELLLSRGSQRVGTQNFMGSTRPATHPLDLRVNAYCT